MASGEGVDRLRDGRAIGGLDVLFVAAESLAKHGEVQDVDAHRADMIARVRHADCTGCGLPVLELEGQYEVLDGTRWHTVCLIASPRGPLAAEQWLRNYLDERHYTIERELPNWTVVTHARGDKVGFSKSGESLSLSSLGSKKKSRKGDGGRVFPKIDEGYNLDLKDSGPIDAVRAGFASEGAFPLLTLYELLGCIDKVHHPDSLDRAVISSIRETTTRHFITMRVEYGLFVPDELL